jgi:hypothetical protein
LVHNRVYHPLDISLQPRLHSGTNGLWQIITTRPSLIAPWKKIISYPLISEISNIENI